VSTEPREAGGRRTSAPQQRSPQELAAALAVLAAETADPPRRIPPRRAAEDEVAEDEVAEVEVAEVEAAEPMAAGPPVTAPEQRSTEETEHEQAEPLPAELEPTRPGSPAGDAAEPASGAEPNPGGLVVGSRLGGPARPADESRMRSGPRTGLIRPGRPQGPGGLRDAYKRGAAPRSAGKSRASRRIGGSASFGDRLRALTRRQWILAGIVAALLLLIVSLIVGGRPTHQAGSTTPGPSPATSGPAPQAPASSPGAPAPLAPHPARAGSSHRAAAGKPARNRRGGHRRHRAHRHHRLRRARRR